jgi:hypothetical protein
MRKENILVKMSGALVNSTWGKRCGAEALRLYALRRKAPRISVMAAWSRFLRQPKRLVEKLVEQDVGSWRKLLL